MLSIMVTSICIVHWFSLAQGDAQLCSIVHSFWYISGNQLLLLIWIFISLSFALAPFLLFRQIHQNRFEPFFSISKWETEFRGFEFRTNATQSIGICISCVCVCDGRWKMKSATFSWQLNLFWAGIQIIWQKRTIILLNLKIAHLKPRLIIALKIPHSKTRLFLPSFSLHSLCARLILRFMFAHNSLPWTRLNYTRWNWRELGQNDEQQRQGESEQKRSWVLCECSTAQTNIKRIKLYLGTKNERKRHTQANKRRKRRNNYV